MSRRATRRDVLDNVLTSDFLSDSTEMQVTLPIAH